MSNRPKLERKHTRKTEEHRGEALDIGLKIKVDGKTYTVRQGDLTAMDANALRRETGHSFMGLMRAFGTDPDIDLIACVVWLSRRTNGERGLSFEEVAEEIGYDVDIDLVGEPGPEEHGDDPEA